MIRLVGVERTFRAGPAEVRALSGVSLEIARGERLAVVGPSGSGKSTLAHILALLDRPTAGHYELDGRDTGGLDDDALAGERNRRIGMVFQSFHLLGRQSALANVRLGLLYRGLDHGHADDRAELALARVGLADRVRFRVGELSGGQQQRVAIARALVGAPALLVADEPTAALDRATADEILDLLVALGEEERLTTVLVTHDAAVAARCQRAVEIRGGRLATSEPSA